VVGFEQILITSAAHQVNSLEERNHTESRRHLRRFLCAAESRMHWSVIAPSAQRIVNAQFSPAIGCSPTTRLHRAAVETETGLFFEFSRREQQELSISEETERTVSVSVWPDPGSCSALGGT
jgi:hypothetical protein